jgi:hypothetical protein
MRCPHCESTTTTEYRARTALGYRRADLVGIRRLLAELGLPWRAEEPRG